MKIILMGPPGAGKGTQGSSLSAELGLPLISISGMLKNLDGFDSGLASEVRAMMNSGALVSDDVIFRLLDQRLKDDDCKSGYCLDGFPRTVAQAEWLLKVVGIMDALVLLDLPDDIIVSRVAERWVCPSSSRVYHLSANPPLKPGVDDETGEPLIQREDDKPEVVIRRLSAYRLQTKPVLNWYSEHGVAVRKWIELDASKSIGQVQCELSDAVKKIMIGD